MRIGAFFALFVTVSQLMPTLPAHANWSDEKNLSGIQAKSPKRNNIFYEGEPITFNLNKPCNGFEIKDYWGNVVDTGKDLQSIKPEKPGWYKLYLNASGGSGEFGATNFVVFRNDPHFPALPSPDTPGGDMYSDEVVRGITGMGPQRNRLSIKPKQMEEYLHMQDARLKLDREFYLPYDPIRQRCLFTAFPDGTDNPQAVSDVVKKYADAVKYWEPGNEPNFGSSGKDFAQKELPQFYKAVKSVDPSLKVIAPGTVSINPSMLAWIEDFLKAGGAQYLDGFSFHFYNNNNGDPFLLRKSLDSLNHLLAKYNADHLEKWQTEHGAFAADYGVYEPRMQSRWIMLQMMLFEQYGIPKEHNHLWYDRSHGFWDVPAWWENGDGSLNPIVALMRVWSEELYGKKFVKAFDFGTPGNALYIGSLFSGAGGSVAAIMSTGDTKGKVDLTVTNANRLRTVSSFGVVHDVTVEKNHFVLDAPELPVYVELKPGQTITAAGTNWGQNLARQPGVVISSPDSKPADLAEINNGEFETYYWEQKTEAGPWGVELPSTPVSIEIDLPAVQTVSRAIVYSSPPWQFFGPLLDYELQYDKDGKWVTIERMTEPTKTFKVATPVNRTSVDTFFSERSIFQHSFKPVSTAKIRLLISDATHGGNPTDVAQDAGGQGFKNRLVYVREIELYGK